MVNKMFGKEAEWEWGWNKTAKETLAPETAAGFVKTSEISKITEEINNNKKKEEEQVTNFNMTNTENLKNLWNEIEKIREKNETNGEKALENAVKAFWDELNKKIKDMKKDDFKKLIWNNDEITKKYFNDEKNYSNLGIKFEGKNYKIVKKDDKISIEEKV